MSGGVGAEAGGGGGVGSDKTIFYGRDVSAANLARIKSSYEKNGVACIRMLCAEKCNELILEQWRNIILKQEWTDAYRITVRCENGRVLDIDDAGDQEQFGKSVVGPLTPPVRKNFEAGWPLHRVFGAFCDVSSGGRVEYPSGP